MRKFKLRDGSIVEEWRGETTCDAGGYIDDYKIVSLGDNPSDYVRVGGWLCLRFSSGGFPKGGAHGEEYDIVEEIEL